MSRLRLSAPELSTADLAVAADLAENGSDAEEKARRRELAELHRDVELGIIRDEYPGSRGILHWPSDWLLKKTTL